MAFWVYILKCADSRYYTGHTDHLERRLAQHHMGGHCEFTSRKRPVSLVWNQNFATRLEAMEAEQRIKAWSRAKKEALMRSDPETLSYFSRPPRERPSTSLRTNGEGQDHQAENHPFVSSEEGQDHQAETDPFVSSEVETPSHHRPSTSLGTNGKTDT